MDSILDELIPDFADDDWDRFVEWVSEQDLSTKMRLALYLKQGWGLLCPHNEDADWVGTAEDLLEFIKACSLSEQTTYPKPE